MATRAAVDSTRKASCFFTFFRIAKPSKQKAYRDVNVTVNVAGNDTENR